MTSETSREDRIRDRAYGIWEREGMADGHHERHWQEASREIDEEGDAGEQPSEAGVALSGEGASAGSIPDDADEEAGSDPLQDTARRTGSAA